MFSKVLISALGAASAVSALVPRGVCNADNCLRALRATSPKTRLAQAQEDCAAWLVVTEIPPVSTETAYTTVSSTATALEEVTVTDTIHTTVTSTVNETPTETVYTATETSTSTVQAGAITTLAKRAEATIPAYASACSGAVRFSSACSCIGVSAVPSTVTAVASTVTVTLPTTVFATVSATATVATSDVVIIDTTIVETVTAPATTVFAVTTTTVTETSSSTSQAPTPTALILKVEGGVRTPGFVGNTDSSDLSYAIYVTNQAQAIQLVLNPDGSLFYGSKIAYGDPSGVNLPFFFYAPGQTVRKPLSCSVDSNDVLTCHNTGVNNNKFGITAQMSLTPVIYTGSATSLAASNRPIVTLKIQRV